MFSCYLPGFIFISAYLFSFPLHAEIKIDQSLPIQIQSDNAFFERITRQATHEGHVVMVQGPNTVYADKLIVRKENGDKNTHVYALGQPAVFIGKMDGEPEPVRATANTINYYPDKQLIVLEGNAQLTHLQDKFQGPMLSYQLDKQIVSASKQSQERPTITIAPNTRKKS